MRLGVLFAVAVVIAAIGIWWTGQRPLPPNETSVDLQSEVATFNLAECIRQEKCRTFEPYAREVLFRNQSESDRPLPPADFVKREAEKGDPDYATEYGQWLYEMNNALAAEPYLEVGAAGGNLEAHATLAALKLQRSAGNDRIEAWAHLRAVEREDGAVDLELFNSIDALIDDDERAAAEDLAWQYREMMRRARNDPERLRD